MHPDFAAIPLHSAASMIITQLTISYTVVTITLHIPSAAFLALQSMIADSCSFPGQGHVIHAFFHCDRHRSPSPNYA